MIQPEFIQNKEFVTVDARVLEGFFLPKIIQTAKTLTGNQGLRVIQSFEPVPLYGVMEKEGWDHFTQKISEEEFHIYFFRTKDAVSSTPDISGASGAPGEKVPIVLQSATPVVYPVILRMLESPGIKEHFEIKKLKVWEETEKHLSWIVSGKADISFSAIIASANLLGKQNDVKLATVTVWDNFYIVTRGYQATKFSDLKDHEIYMPLFKKAPPAQVTRFLMHRFGENPEEYHFVYGQPFGRPEEIAQKLIEGKIDTALIREPEVSYALNADANIHVAVSYSDLWKQLKPGSNGLPNAGLVFKGSFFREYPDHARLFLSELNEAIAWIKQNPDEAARLSYKVMGHSYQDVRLFLDRVNYNNVPAIQVKDEIRDYLTVIEDQRIAELLQQQTTDLFVTEFFNETVSIGQGVSS